MSAVTYTQDPDAVLDYTVDWAAWLDDDTISVSTWTAESGIEIADDSSTDTTATVFVSGGTVGERYAVTNHIVTAGGREDDRTLTIRIREQ